MDYVFREGMIDQIYPPDYVEPWEKINSWFIYQKDDGDDFCYDPRLKLCKDKDCEKLWDYPIDFELTEESGIFNLVIHVGETFT